MTENKFTYWAFLSYSQQDNCETRPGAQDVVSLRWGDWLHDVLQAFSIPADFAGQINARGEIIPERIDPIFQDGEEQSENASLNEPLRQALEQSKCLIVICSPRSARSLHVNEAVRYFKQLGRGNRILPIVIAGEPNAGEANKPGSSPDQECFVPALRHPVQPDGTLDTTRRDRGPIFADARYGEDKREILANDHQHADTELETARIQLIAGLIGVGFNGLWGREQRRRFAEAQQLAREAQEQIQAARTQAQTAQSQVLEIQNQAREARAQLEEARRQARAAEGKVLAAQDQAREAQNQLEAARNQVRDAQNKVLEIQNLPQDVKSQIQEAQNQAREAQHQVQELEAQTREAQAQIQEARDQARQAQDQAEEARHQARAAEAKVLEAQHQARETQNQLEAARSQVREAEEKVLAIQSQVQKMENRVREAQSQAEEARQQARAAESKVLEAQRQAQEAEKQIEQAHDEARAAQDKIQSMQDQTRDAQSQIQQAQQQTREADNRAAQTQNQVEEIQQKTQAARRLSKVLAIMAVLALLAAGMAASVALRQRKTASLALARAAEAEARESALAASSTNRESIWQTLQKISGAEPEANQRRRLDELAARIPTEAIPEALKASAILADDRQRSRFQKQLLVRLGEVNPPSAMAGASAIEGRIVNEDGSIDSYMGLQLAVLDGWRKTDLPGALGWVLQLPDAEARQRALEEIIPALAADNPQAALAQLNDMEPAPGERSYTLLFQHWAATDPVQAIQHWQTIPDQDDRDKVRDAILAVWVDQQPEAALNWVKSQPDSESKNQAMETCIGGLAKTDVPKALALTESLPEGSWRNTMIAGLFNDWAGKDLASATTACQQLPDGLAKEKAGEYVLSRRIDQDPASAAEAVKNLPPGDHRQQAIEQLCQRWAGADLPAVLAWAQSLPSETERAAAFNQLAARWADKDPQAAIQFAGQHPDLSSDALGEIGKAWAKNDLAAATSWVESLPDGEKKDAVLLAMAGATAGNEPALAAKYCTLFTTAPTQPMLEQVRAIAGTLAKDDISGAVEWARGLKAETARQAALSAFSEAWAQNDPKGMAAYALGLPAGEAQTEYLTAACAALAMCDFPGTLALLQPLTDDELRRGLIEQAVRGCDLPHLDQAAKYIAAMPAGKDQEAAIQGLLSRWTPTDPEMAVNWLRSFPENNPQTEPMQLVIKAWSQAEPAAVARWLANLPVGTASAGMVNAFLDGAVGKYPEFAGQWAKSVTDETKRKDYVLQVARQWMKTDPSAATNWIDRLDFPEEIKAPLKAQLP